MCNILSLDGDGGDMDEHGPSVGGAGRFTELNEGQWLGVESEPEGVRLEWKQSPPAWPGPCYTQEPKAPCVWVPGLFVSASRLTPVSSKTHRHQTQVFTYLIV